MMINLKTLAVALTATLLLPLAACSAGTEPVRAGAADPKTAAGAAPPTKAAPAVKDLPDGQADVCSNVDPKTFKLAPDLAAAYTIEEVAQATCEAIRFQYVAGWTDLAVPADTIDASSGQAITETLRPWLTERALSKADTLAVKSATGDDKADQDLYPLTMVSLENPDWDLRRLVNHDALLVDERSWGDATLALDKTFDAAGRERVDVTIEFTDRLLLARKSDQAPGSVTVTRAITYAMSQTSLNDHPWLVDGSSAKWTFGTPTPDAKAAKS